MTAAPKICVCICTYKRPGQLARLLDHLESTELLGARIMVIDNDKHGSAEAVTRKSGAIYEIEPGHGYATARNTALRTAFSDDADYVAFLDDDDAPDRDWLAELVKAGPADLVFGQWYTEQKAPRLLSRIKLFAPAKARVTEDYGVPLPQPTGTCNVLIGREVFSTMGDQPFSEAFNRLGGEDTDLFIRAAKAGLEWRLATKSLVNKRLDPARLNIRGVLKIAIRRRFTNTLIVRRHATAAAARKRRLNAGRRIASALVKLPLQLHNPPKAVASLYKIACSGGVLAGYLSRNPIKDRPPKVELFYWRPKTGDNFGDALSRVIVNEVLARRGLSLETQTCKPARLLAVGSILHFARDSDVVWGSGCRSLSHDHNFKSLDVRAVRGPLTWEFLRSRGIEAPEIFGDPAMLLPVLFPCRFERSNKHDLTIVTHFKDTVAHLNAVIHATAPWDRIVERIAASAFVLSSSLHGIIVAEALGIPARYLRVSDYEPLFKFRDYYEGTGRTMTFATSVAMGIEMGGMPLPVTDRERLLASFPLDLWR